MQGRSGPFWDGVEGRAPIPPRRGPGIPAGVAARRRRGGRRHRHRDRPGDPAGPGTGRGLTSADPTKEKVSMAKIVLDMPITFVTAADAPGVTHVRDRVCPKA